jgi:hypothetical protein
MKIPDMVPLAEADVIVVKQQQAYGNDSRKHEN